LIPFETVFAGKVRPVRAGVRAGEEVRGVRERPAGLEIVLGTASPRGRACGTSPISGPGGWRNTRQGLGNQEEKEDLPRQ